MQAIYSAIFFTVCLTSLVGARPKFQTLSLNAQTTGAFLNPLGATVKQQSLYGSPYGYSPLGGFGFGNGLTGYGSPYGGVINPLALGAYNPKLGGYGSKYTSGYSGISNSYFAPKMYSSKKNYYKTGYPTFGNFAGAYGGFGLYPQMGAQGVYGKYHGSKQTNYGYGYPAISAVHQVNYNFGYPPYGAVNKLSGYGK